MTEFFFCKTLNFERIALMYRYCCPPSIRIEHTDWLIILIETSVKINNRAREKRPLFISFWVIFISFLIFQMLKITCFPFKNFRRTVYTAIKSINEPPFPRTKTLSSIATTTPRQMQAWIIYYYGTNQQFTLSSNVQIPTILSPSDVLIKVSASSINPIDIRRRGTINKKSHLTSFIFSFSLRGLWSTINQHLSNIEKCSRTWK